MPTVPDIIQMIDKVATPQDPQGKAPEWTTPIKLVVIFTVLAIIPSLLAMTTSFTRIVIVLSFVRQALGTQSIPPTTALMGLALFLTLYTMAPTFMAMNDQAIQPYLRNEVVFADAMAKSSGVMKEFMIRQTRNEDLKLFVQNGQDGPAQDGAGIAVSCRRAGVHYQRVSHGVRNRMPDVHSVFAAGPGHRQRAAQRGHDDASAGDDLVAV